MQTESKHAKGLPAGGALGLAASNLWVRHFGRRRARHTVTLSSPVRGDDTGISSGVPGVLANCFQNCFQPADNGLLEQPPLRPLGGGSTYY